MKTNSFIAIVSALLLAGAFLTGCEKDPKGPEVEAISAYNDLSFFQSAFVDVGPLNEDGVESYAIYSVGEAIYEDDATNLYIGVDNLEEALGYWNASLAPDIARTVSADNKYTYTLTDEEGKSQGSVSFTPGAAGSVAQITTSASGLKYFSKVTFILNSAWPFNAGSEARSHLGDVRFFRVPELGVIPFVCVREQGNGVKPLFVAITKERHQLPSEDMRSHLLETKWCPGSAKAKEIYNVLHLDWDFFVAVFEDAGGGKLDEDSACWIDGRDRYPFSEFQHGVNLTADKVEHCEDRWDTYWRQPNKRILLKVDWLDDDSLYYIPMDGTGSYNSEEYDNLFDGQKGTKWCTGSYYKTATSVADAKSKCWFAEFDTMEVLAPTGYTLISANDISKYKERNPKSWALLGKRNMEDSWTLLDKRTNTNISTSNYTGTNYPIASDLVKEYKYYRFEVLENQNSEKSMMLGGLKLIYE